MLTWCGCEERIHMRRSPMKCISWKMFETREAILLGQNSVDGGVPGVR